VWKLLPACLQTPHDPQPLSWLQRLMGAGPSSGPEARVAYVQPASPSSFSLEALSELASALVATKHHLLGRDGTCTKLLKAVCHTASSQMLAHIGQHLPLNDAQAAERAPASQLQASVINTARLLAALGQAGHLTLLLLDSSAAVTAQALAHPSQPGMPTQVCACVWLQDVFTAAWVQCDGLLYISAHASLCTTFQQL
jgi:hypothetical protein